MEKERNAAAVVLTHKCTPAERKEVFMELFRGFVNRAGAADLLNWMEHETDFFTAPASASHHGAVEGGLVAHSLNVYTRLCEITCRDTGRWNGDPEEHETVVILALLHDLCKVNVYHKETKRKRDPETGVWGDVAAWTFRDPLPLGHGEKSLFLICRFMKLTTAEALAIRWNMGAYDDAAKGGSKALNAAMEMTPWVWRLHEADMCATHIDEREGSGE